MSSGGGRSAAALRVVQDDAVDAADAIETVDAATLRTAFRRAPAGLAVVTTTHEGRPTGLTVTSLRSLSVDPALVTFSITRTASTWPALSRAEVVLVHLLDERHHGLAARFATSGVDRFAAPVRHQLDAGLPRLLDAATVLRCVVEDLRSYGDADLFVAAVTAVEHQPPGAQPAPGGLVYHDGGFHLLRPIREGQP